MRLRWQRLDTRKVDVFYHAIACQSCELSTVGLTRVKMHCRKLSPCASTRAWSAKKKEKEG